MKRIQQNVFIKFLVATFTIVGVFLHNSTSVLAAEPQYIDISYQAHCQDVGWQSWKSNW